MRTRLKRLLDHLMNEKQGQPALRRAALARGSELGGVPRPGAEDLPPAWTRYIELVARQAWKITDEDVAELRKANLDEDAIYEATVAAATGAAVARYEIAMRAVADRRRAMEVK